MTQPRARLLCDLNALRLFAVHLVQSAPSVLSDDELISLADAAALRAWSLFDPDRGASFVTFARIHIRGDVRRALCRRRRAWALVPPRATVDTLALPQPSSELLALAHEIASLLDPVELDVTQRFAGGETLSEIARSHGRHPSWASRKLAAIRARFRQPDLPTSER